MVHQQGRQVSDRFVVRHGIDDFESALGFFGHEMDEYWAQKDFESRYREERIGSVSMTRKARVLALTLAQRGSWRRNRVVNAKSRKNGATRELTIGEVIGLAVSGSALPAADDLHEMLENLRRGKESVDTCGVQPRNTEGQRRFRERHPGYSNRYKRKTDKEAIRQKLLAVLAAAEKAEAEKAHATREPLPLPAPAETVQIPGVNMIPATPAQAPLPVLVEMSGQATIRPLSAKSLAA